MNDKPVVVLNGESLSIKDIVLVGVGDKRIELDPAALERSQKSRDFIESEVAAERIIYGVNTSFGPMCNKIISDDKIEQLQVNLIRSHAAGLGRALPPYVAISVLVVRLNTLLKGYSGVRLELLEFMKRMIDNRIAPYIPRAGSVGASGDLIHLAHVGLGIIGEGNVFLDGKLTSAKEAYARVDMEPMRLTYKEGIALINGTAAAAALAAFAIINAQKLFRLACVTGAFGLEIFGGIDDAFDEDLHRVKPHPGQVKVAQIIRSLYAGSDNITLRSAMHEKIREEQTDGLVYETTINVQDVYSIRCTPQILAPVQEAIEMAATTIETEANSCNDNPVIIPDANKVIHGGNFHGQSVGFVMDMLCIALSTLSNLSERRINKLLDPNLNEGLPEHLIPGTVGLTMGLMGAQYLATSCTAENRQLSNPVSTNSISTNASNQDVVPMSTVAARKAYRSASNAKHIITLEVLAILQALSFRNAETLGKGTSRIYELLSRDFTVYDNERAFHDDLVKFRKILFASPHFEDLSIYCD